MNRLWWQLIIFCLVIIFIEHNLSSSLNNQKNTTLSPLQTSISPDTPASTFTAPIDKAAQRITKKPFGIYVTPNNSPVNPERFTGYHTGVDFEIFDNEKDAEVKITAICEGPILEKRSATGYGGILVQSCQLKNEPVTIVYGHLKLSSIKQKISDQLKAGENFAILGKAYSPETGGERKHLHLGIIKGTAIDIRGYVQKKAELSAWIDYQSL